MATNAIPKTLFEKVWQQHLVAEPAGEPSILYIDLQLVHEVTSPQAFEGLRLAGRKLRRPDRHIATVDGDRPFGVTAKDIILDITRRIGTAGATGYAVEYAGSAIRALSMEGRMTICNMSIEAGARAGMIAPDETTFAYLKGRRFAPQGEAWDKAVAEWRKLPSDPGAKFDRELVIDAASLVPYVSWGTSPGMVTSINGDVP